ncbi:hypothetical protein GCM10023329_50570 [Streptomyces sanyensis]|uniref:Uncharacterized protein n=1 Tax=Streptomyces sanyensis TaxID=568869 RepID=A0ABP9B9U7_9ACTN
MKERQAAQERDRALGDQQHRHGRARGRRCLVAVLSDDQPSRSAGISLVETLAQQAVALLAPDMAPSPRR